eukprot:scpid56315/ scgid9723/ 
MVGLKSAAADRKITARLLLVYQLLHVPVVVAELMPSLLCCWTNAAKRTRIEKTHRNYTCDCSLSPRNPFNVLKTSTLTHLHTYILTQTASAECHGPATTI